MPLKPDRVDRGDHATHVHRHPKLGRHRTVINTALPLVNKLIDNKSVELVMLGRIWYPTSQSFTPYVGVEARGWRIGITISGEDAMQVIYAKAADGNASRSIADSIRQTWVAA